MKLASTYVYFCSPGAGADEISRAGTAYFCIFLAAGRGRVLTYIFDCRAGVHMKLAGPVPHTSAYFSLPGGGAHEIGKHLRIFLIAGRGRT